MPGCTRHEIADAVEAGLRRRARQDDDEQAVYGFDRLDELGLHPLLQAALRDAGYGVWPERHYPSDRGRRSRSQGKRCDMVLTPDGRDLREPDVAGTLFDDPNAVDLGEAYWLEVKSVAQFETTGPFRRYSAELLQPVAQDVKKLWGDPLIFRAGLLLLLFTADQPTADHDLAAWHHRCLDKGYPLMSPAVRGIRLTDRIGNGWCTVALFGVRGG